MNATDHEIYKKRGRTNIQIGLVLGAFVVIVMIATIARLSNSPMATSVQEQVAQEQEASQ